MKKTELLLLILLFFAAVSFRMWFIGLAPQPLVYDQLEYNNYATKIFNAPFMLASHSYRSYPASFLFALVYKVAGYNNHPAIFLVQALLDSAVVLMVFFMLRAMTSFRPAAWIGGVMYAVNPFTSGFVGTLSSEILTIFFIAAMALAGIRFVTKPTVFRGIVFGLCAGMAVETRNAVLMSAIAAVGTVFFFLKRKIRIQMVTGIVIGALMTTVYPFYTNWRDWHQVTPFKVDSFYAMEFYNGASLKILPPFAGPLDYPVGQQEMWREYWSEYFPGRTVAERRAIAAKYLNKGWKIVKEDPLDYLKWRFYKMWYVWQKENIFYIVEQNYESHKQYTYWVNIGLLGLAAVGMALWRRIIKHTSTAIWIVSAGFWMIVLQTVAFGFSHAEYRLTIPLYPIVIMFAALGISALLWRGRSR